MQVPMSWGERFITHMYNHRKLLYIRGESKCKDYMETMKLQMTMLQSLQPLFDQFRKEAYLQGYQDGYMGEKSQYPQENDK